MWGEEAVRPWSHWLGFGEAVPLQHLAMHDGRPHALPAEPTSMEMKRIILFQTIMCLSLQDNIKDYCHLLA